MHLYQGTTNQFIGDATQARLACQLADRFFDESRYRPPDSEVRAWQNLRGAVVEPKQWTDVGRSNITDCVTVDLGGRVRDHLHLIRQAACAPRSWISAADGCPGDDSLRCRP